MAKRKFRVLVTEKQPPPSTTDADGNIEADRFEVKDGAALFVIDGFVVMALAPGQWARVEIVPVKGEKPTRPRT